MTQAYLLYLARRAQLDSHHLPGFYARTARTTIHTCAERENRSRKRPLGIKSYYGEFISTSASPTIELSCLHQPSLKSLKSRSRNPLPGSQCRPQNNLRAPAPA